MRGRTWNIYRKGGGVMHPKISETISPQLPHSPRANFSTRGIYCKSFGFPACRNLSWFAYMYRHLEPSPVQVWHLLNQRCWRTGRQSVCQHYMTSSIPAIAHTRMPGSAPRLMQAIYFLQLCLLRRISNAHVKIRKRLTLCLEFVIDVRLQFSSSQ
jgi:hypothetical protein